MSIKLTKMYTIRYSQRPNNYFTQSLRHFVGVDMDLGDRRHLNLAVDEFSRHEANEPVVANRHERWIRNFSKITSQLSAFTCGRTGKSVRRFLIFTALLCTPCISSVQFLYYLPVIKKNTLPSLKAPRAIRLSPKYKEGLVSTTNRLRQSLDADESMIQGKKVFQNQVLRGRIHVVNRMIDNRTTYTKYRT